MCTRDKVPICQIDTVRNVSMCPCVLCFLPKYLTFLYLIVLHIGSCTFCVYVASVGRSRNICGMGGRLHFPFILGGAVMALLETLGCRAACLCVPALCQKAVRKEKLEEAFTTIFFNLVGDGNAILGAIISVACGPSG